MKKTLLDLEGAVLRFVADRDSLDRRPLRDAINESYQELYERARDAEVTGIQSVARVGLVADQDVYSLPDNVVDLKGVERLDLGNEPVPLTEIPYGQMFRAYRADRRGYVLLPGGRQIRLMQMPQENLADGLMFWHTARTVMLQNNDDVPVLPHEAHEAIVALALLRVRAWATLRNPKEAEVFIAASSQRFQRFLEPDGRTRPGSLVPSFPFHIPMHRRPD